MMNVLLVTDWNDKFKFNEVARNLRKMGFRARIVHDVEPTAKHRLWTLGMPTKIISMSPLTKFTPKWAEIWQQQNIDKTDEYRLLGNAGIPVPKWVPVYEGKTPDLTGFPEYVVVKPSLGWKGAFVRIMRRDKVCYRAISTELMDGIVSPSLVAQEYIHTGAWPINYRVGTVFGEPTHMFRSTADANRLPFYGDKFDAGFFAGRSVVASAQGCVRDGEVPQDVVDLACEAHLKAFPDFPLLGVDIIRDFQTQKLYVVEVNAFGRTYMTARDSKHHIETFGFDLNEQFGGIKAVTRGIYNRLMREGSGVKSANFNEGNLTSCAAS